MKINQYSINFIGRRVWLFFNLDFNLEGRLIHLKWLHISDIHYDNINDGTQTIMLRKDFEKKKSQNEFPMQVGLAKKTN